MKLFKKLTWSILLASCVLVFTACSDDDNGDDITPPTIMQPKFVSDMSMSYRDGLLTKIATTDGKTITFDYSTKSRSSSESMKMTIEYDDDPKDIRHFDMQLNSNGYIKSCIQTYADNNDVETWEFEYDSDGHLVQMKRSEGNNEVTTIKYESGNITKVSMTSDEDDNTLNAKVFYTSIENKNNIMLFDITFGIDMDEMKYAYWAGLLGNATKQLPVKITYNENSDEEEAETFEWTIKNDYVQKMIQITSWGTEEHFFTWE